MMQGGVNIHTMSPKSAVIDALDNAGYEVNEQVDKDIPRIKDQQVFNSFPTKRIKVP